MTTGNFRVKVYILDETNKKWIDGGTGNFQFKFLEKFNSLCLQVTDEASIKTIFESKVLKGEDVYKKEGEKIISWKDPLFEDKHCALSFEDATEASLVYLRLTTATPHSASSSSKTSVNESEGDKALFGVTLPPSKQKLINELLIICRKEDELIAKFDQVFDMLKELLQEKGSVPEYKLLVFKLTSPDLKFSFKSILELIILSFNGLERRRKRLTLGNLFELVKSLIQANEPKFFEVFLRENVFPSFCGCFEYDWQYNGAPEGGDQDDMEEVEPKKPRSPPYRQLLQETQFDNIMGIQNKTVLEKIHQNFRIIFFKDVLLNRILDEIPYGILSDIEQVNYSDIIGILHDEVGFVNTVFSKIKSDDAETRRRGLRFLRELFLHVKSLEDVQAIVSYEAHVGQSIRINSKESLFMVLSEKLCILEQDEEDLYCVGEILKFCLEHDPLAFRHYSVNEVPLTESPGLLAQLIECFLKRHSEGVYHLFSEIFFLMLDTVNTSQNDIREAFMNAFYNIHAPKLFYPLLQLDVVSSNHQPGTLLPLLIQLLSFCIQKHNFSIKYFIAKHAVIPKILGILRWEDATSGHKNKQAQSAALKFLKTVISTQGDKFYVKYIVRNNSLCPVFQYMKELQTEGTKGMLYSTCLELINWIIETNDDSLIEYIAANEEFLDVIFAIDEGALDKSFRALVNKTTSQKGTENSSPQNSDKENKMHVEEEVDMFVAKTTEEFDDHEIKPLEEVSADFVPRRKDTLDDEDFTFGTESKLERVGIVDSLWEKKKRKKMKSPVEISFDLEMP